MPVTTAIRSATFPIVLENAGHGGIEATISCRTADGVVHSTTALLALPDVLPGTTSITVNVGLHVSPPEPVAPTLHDLISTAIRSHKFGATWDEIADGVLRVLADQDNLLDRLDSEVSGSADEDEDDDDD